MRRSATLLLVGLLGLVGLASGCGDDDGGRAADLDDETTTTAAPESGDTEVVCEHLARVDQLDRESNRTTQSALAQMDAGADPAIVIAAIQQTAAMFQGSQAEVAERYTAAAAAASPEVAAEIQTLAASTAVLTPLLIDAFGSVDSVDDLATLDQVFNSPAALTASQDGAAAVLSLDRFTEAVCGFSMSD